MSTTSTRYDLDKVADDDAVANYPALNQDLVDDLDRLLPCAGVVTANVAAANTTYNMRVDFDRPFATGITPIVVVSSQNSTNPEQVTLGVYNADNTGFTLYYRRSSGTVNIRAGYIAQAPV